MVSKPVLKPCIKYSYIAKDLIYMMELIDLTQSKKYIKFDGKEFIITKSCSTLIRLSKTEIEISLLVNDNSDNEIILGMSFLQMCKPWNISDDYLRVTIGGSELVISK